MSESPYDLRLSGLLQRLMRSLHIQAQRYSLAQKVSFSEFKVLFLLRTGEPVEMGEIRKNLSITRPCATAIADRLVMHKLVNRRRNTKDRRKVTISLTKKGRNYLAKFEAFKKRFFAALVDGLKEEDKKIMERGIAILVGSLEFMKKLDI